MREYLFAAFRICRSSVLLFLFRPPKADDGYMRFVFPCILITNLFAPWSGAPWGRWIPISCSSTYLNLCCAPADLLLRESVSISHVLPYITTRANLFVSAPLVGFSYIWLSKYPFTIALGSYFHICRDDPSIKYKSEWTTSTPRCHPSGSSTTCRP